MQKELQSFSFIAVHAMMYVLHTTGRNIVELYAWALWSDPNFPAEVMQDSPDCIYNWIFEYWVSENFMLFTAETVKTSLNFEFWSFS